MSLQRRVRAIQCFLRQRKDALRFDDITDPRNRRGRRWSAAALLSAAMMGLLTLARSLRSAESLSQDLASTRRIPGLRRRVPDSTLGDFLSRLEPQELGGHLHRQVLVEHRRKALEPTVLPIRAISIDGKVTATLDHQAHPACQEQTSSTGPPRFCFRVMNATLISAAAPLCIEQRSIAAATNEMGFFGEYFDGLLKIYGRADLFEAVVTDAGCTSEANARRVDDADKAYVMALKGNQPELESEARRVFATLVEKQTPEAETDWELDSSRGWIKRQLFRTDELRGWGAWTHLRQVWMVRVLCSPGRGRQGPIQILEDRLYVTNLPWGRLQPEAILRLVRAHWRIENELHGTLDIQWQEDHGNWVRRGQGLPVSALLRVIAYNLLMLLRAVHLRSAQARAAAWQQVRDWIRDALVWPETPQQNESVEVDFATL